MFTATILYLRHPKSPAFLTVGRCALPMAWMIDSDLAYPTDSYQWIRYFDRSQFHVSHVDLYPSATNQSITFLASRGYLSISIEPRPVSSFVSPCPYGSVRF